MKLLIDMNLSPEFCTQLDAEGWQTKHWSQVGASNAPDAEIMDWALQSDFVVVTHDLDFGAILAVTQANGPSVIQVRTQDVTPEHLVPLLLQVFKDHQPTIEAGALVIVEEARSRIRILPIDR